MVFWVPILAWVVALVAAGVALGRGPRPITPYRIARALLRYVLLIPLGLLGLWGFTGHVFVPDQVAASIGWAPSPFQLEVGVANLGIGVTAIIAAFRKELGFSMAVGIMALCFLGGAGVGHLIQIEQTADMAAGNAGPILYTDFITPIAVIVLVALVRILPGGRSEA